MAIRHIYRPAPSWYDPSRALWRSGAAIKANPPRGGGAKPMDLSTLEGGSRAAERWWGHGRESPKERAPPLHSKRGGALACAFALHASLFGPMVLRTMSERG